MAPSAAEATGSGSRIFGQVNQSGFILSQVFANARSGRRAAECDFSYVVAASGRSDSRAECGTKGTFEKVVGVQEVIQLKIQDSGKENFPHSCFCAAAAPADVAARAPHSAGICGFHDSAPHGAAVDSRSDSGSLRRS